jgi:uncharacterized membrane protein
MAKPILTAMIIALLISAGFCAPQAIEISADIEITPQLQTRQTLNYTLFNDEENASSILLLMPNMPDTFEVFDSNLKLANYSTGISAGAFVIKINDFMQANSTKSYIVRVYDNPISHFGDSNIFSYNFLSYYELEKFSLKLYIPDDYAIASSQGNSISPLPERLYTIDGGIMLEWSAKLNYMDSKNFIVFFEKSQKNNIAALWIILSAIGGFIFGAIISFIFAKKISAKALTQVLSKDEKSITDLLLQRKELTQKEIGETLDLSKPKLSKLIAGLSKKGIIIVEPYGRKNIIKLAKGAL